MKWFYLCGAVTGAVSTWYFNLHVLAETGTFSALEFVTVGFSGSSMLGSLASDFWVGCTVSTVFMVVEARRIGMRGAWVLVLLALLVAWAFALPLFFFLRARHLEREAEREG